MGSLGLSEPAQLAPPAPAAWQKQPLGAIENVVPAPAQQKANFAKVKVGFHQLWMSHYTIHTLATTHVSRQHLPVTCSSIEKHMGHSLQRGACCKRRFVCSSQCRARRRAASGRSTACQSWSLRRLTLTRALAAPAAATSCGCEARAQYAGHVVVGCKPTAWLGAPGWLQVSWCWYWVGLISTNNANEQAAAWVCVRSCGLLKQ